MADNYDDLQQSYGRCLRGKNFIERFYEIFLASHPDIAPMFAETDFQKQRMALRRGISGGLRLRVPRLIAEQAEGLTEALGIVGTCLSACCACAARAPGAPGWSGGARGACGRRRTRRRR